VVKHQAEVAKVEMPSTVRCIILPIQIYIKKSSK